MSTTRRRPFREWVVERAPQPPTPRDYPSRLHSEAVAARVGLLLGAAFGICFITGLLSHLIQHPPEWFGWPTSPIWLYRVTQGVHISTGIASIPLLLVKLWTVSPRFWQFPPVTSVLNGTERASIFLLVGASIFQLITGLFNVAEFYPWSFFFTTMHYAIAYVAIGALVIHIAVKLPVIRRALGAPISTDPAGITGEDDPAASPRTFVGPMSRRGLLGLAGVGAVLGVVATVGDKLPAFRTVSVLAQRNGSGPQGLPVNRTARAAGVTDKVTAADWQMMLTGPGGSRTLSLAELRAMPQSTFRLPISCVEGWSQTATWTGIPLRDLIGLVGGGGLGAHVVSAEDGLYGSSDVTAKLAADELTLVALELEGSPLDLDHGYPARLIAPNRPGVLQTKWISHIEVA